jgi:hypothetical protein
MGVLVGGKKAMIRITNLFPAFTKGIIEGPMIGRVEVVEDEVRVFKLVEVDKNVDVRIDEEFELIETELGVTLGVTIVVDEPEEVVELKNNETVDSEVDE